MGKKVFNFDAECATISCEWDKIHKNKSCWNWPLNMVSALFVQNNKDQHREIKEACL